MCTPNPSTPMVRREENWLEAHAGEEAEETVEGREPAPQVVSDLRSPHENITYSRAQIRK